MFAYKPIAEISDADFQRLRFTNRNISETPPAKLSPVCGICPHQNTFCFSRPCQKSQRNPFLVKHLCDAIVRLGFSPQKVFLYRNSGRICFCFANRKPLKFNLNQFSSGRELAQSLGVACWRNPTIHENFSQFATLDVLRWRTKTKLTREELEMYCKIILQQTSKSS